MEAGDASGWRSWNISRGTGMPAAESAWPRGRSPDPGAALTGVSPGRDRTMKAAAPASADDLAPLGGLIVDDLV